MPRRALNSPLVWCLLSAALFGASTPVAKSLLAELGPITLAGALYLGAALGVLPFCAKGGSPERRKQPRHWLYLAGAVGFGGIVGPVLLLIGLDRTPAASAALWLNLETVATAVLAWAFFREYLGVRTWLAVLCVVAAGLLLAAPFETGTLVGAALIAMACVCWGLDNNFTALIDGYTPAQSTAVKGLVAGGVNLALGLAIESAPTLSSVGLALVVGAFAYGISIMLYISSAHQLGATRSQLVFASAPLWGVGLAWLAFAESVAWNQVVALVPMVIGIALLVRGEHAHDHRHDAITHSHSHRHDDGHHTHVHPGLPAWLRHTHEHAHEPVSHSHAHEPDLHHRHVH